MSTRGRLSSLDKRPQCGWVRSPQTGWLARASRGLTLLLILGFCGCSTPRIRSVWTDPGLQPGAMSALALVMVDHSEVLRAGIENSLAERLTERGVKSLTTYTAYPLEALREGEATIRQRLIEDGLEGVLVCRMTHQVSKDSGREPEYRPYAGSYLDPSWRENFRLTSVEVYDPGYLDSRDIVFLEVEVFELESQRELWKCVIEVSLALDEDYVPKMHRFADQVVQRLVKDRVIPTEDGVRTSR